MTAFGGERESWMAQVGDFFLQALDPTMFVKAMLKNGMVGCASSFRAWLLKQSCPFVQQLLAGCVVIIAAKFHAVGRIEDVQTTGIVMILCTTTCFLSVC